MENFGKTEIDEARSEDLQTQIFETTAKLNGLLGLPEFLTPAATTELARTIARGLEVLVQCDMPEEDFGEMISKLRQSSEITGKAHLGAVVGHFVMECLGEGVSMDLEGKTFLMKVADVLGPDHIEGLRRNVAFMIKVGGFN